MKITIWDTTLIVDNWINPLIIELTIRTPDVTAEYMSVMAKSVGLTPEEPTVLSFCR